MGRHGRWWLGLAALTAALVAAPAASADRILFISERNSGEVWVMNEDGSGQASTVRRAPSGYLATWSPDGLRVAFGGGYGEAEQLWIMRLDRPTLRGLGLRVSIDGDHVAADWSPSGRQLVVASGGGLRIVRRDGTRRRALAGTTAGTDPAWLPTGGLIAYQGLDGLTLIRPDGTGRRAIGSGFHPDWAPSGRRIVVSDSSTGFNSDLYSMRADGSDRRRLTHTPAWEERPAWSPGGGSIAFERAEAIWVMNADGTRVRRVATNARFPAWSPNGRRLLFSREQSDQAGAVRALFTVRLDGSGLRRVLTPESDSDVAASPDGTRIAFTSLRPFSQSGIYVADADGGNETFVHAGFAPDWSPDGSRIVFQVDDTQAYLADGDGSDPTPVPVPVAHDLGIAWGWRWHPDGYLSFVGETESDFCSDVYTMQLDGTAVTRVTPATCSPNLWEFDWNPTGTTLVLSATACPDCPVRLYSQAVPGGAPVPLAGDANRHDTNPSISPDGAVVVFGREIVPSEFTHRTIWRMNIDGSGPTRLTSGPWDFAPAWLPEPP